MTDKRIINSIVVLAVSLIGGAGINAQEYPTLRPSELPPPSGTIIRYATRHHPVYAENGMLVSQNKRASQAGLAILKQGGNAVDAAVTVATVLAVTLPRAGNIAGGGFMLVYDAEAGKTTAFDFRSTAPGGVSPATFIGADGKVDMDKLRNSPAAATVPGTIAGLDLAHRKFGSMKWRDLLQPAYKLARDGIPVSRDLRGVLAATSDWMGVSDLSRSTYYIDGQAPPVGHLHKRPRLAWTLRRLARKGAEDFYQGEIARRIAADMDELGGFISATDLADYRVVESTPLAVDYRGHQVQTMPPPSAGAILLQMLNMLECHELEAIPHGSARHLHLLTETMKRAYRDRLEFIEDPAFVPVPTQGLISKSYARQLCAEFKPGQPTTVANLDAIDPWQYESPDTTHFSIVDRHGNAVAVTYTLGSSFGSGVSLPGTGILTNNQMRIFLKPGTSKETDPVKRFRPVHKGKRMISTMSPVIVLKDGKPMLVTGSPGGDRIPVVNLQVISNIIDYGMNPATALQAPRVHHNYVVDVLRYEEGFSPDTLHILKSMGHEIRREAIMGSAQTIVIRQGLWGAADQRRPGALAIGY